MRKNVLQVNLIRLIYLLAVALLIVMFAPLAYKVPYFDDWYFAAEISTNGVVEFCVNFYKNWSGRYTSIVFLSFFSSNPNSVLYQFVPILMFGLNLGIWFAILRQNKWFKLPSRDAFFVSFIHFVLYYGSLAEPFSGLYWHCSSFYLMAPAYFGLFVLALNSVTRSYYKHVLVICAIVLVAGTMELLIMLLCAVLFWISIYFWSDRIKRNVFLSYLALAIVASLVNVLAPGNFGRADVSADIDPTSINYFLVLVKSLYYFIIMDVGVVLGVKNGLVISILTFVLIRVYSDKISIPKVTARFFWLSLLSFIGVFVLMHCLFIAVAGYPMAGRVLNIVQFFYLVLIPFYLLLAEQMYLKKVPINFKKFANPVIILVLVFSITQLVSGERKKIIKSTLTELPEFYNSYQQLLFNIEATGDFESVDFLLQPQAFKLNYHPDSLNEFNTEKYRNEMKLYY